MNSATSSTDMPSPSTFSIALATAIISIATGYMLGTASFLGFFGNKSSSSSRNSKKSPRKSWPNSYDVKIHPDSSDEEVMAALKSTSTKGAEDSSEEETSDSGDENASGELEAFDNIKDECKLVLVVRTDLGMGKGKIAAQCSHATLACYKYFLQHAPKSPLLRRWEGLGQAKIAVQCHSEEELLTLQAQALSLGLCARVIRDQGRTQIAAGSATVLGVGPGPKGVVDRVTGGLKLL